MASATRTVAFDGPLDIPASLAPLGRWGDDGIDRWDGARLLRVVRVGPADGRAAPYLARPTGTIDSPALEVTAEAADLDAVIEVVRAGFVADNLALAALCSTDPIIAAADGAHRGVRPVIHRDPFTALIRSISAQQVNLTWAATTRRRLAERFGSPLPIAGETVSILDAGRLAAAVVDDLRALHITYARSRSVIAMSQAVVDGRLDRAELAAMDDAALVARLVKLPGIGPWSADWYLARTLGRPRVVAGDLGVRKAVGRAYFGGRMPSEAQVRDRTRHWGAAAGIAQQLLLHDLMQRP